MKPEVIVSVPHSGTRTLVDYLGLRANEQGFDGSAWWHFGSHYNLMAINRVLFGHGIEVHAHIPIRNPLHVARSWAQRNTPLAKMLECYAHMFMFIDAFPTDHTLYRMEDLPRLRGTNEHIGAPDDSPQIQQFQAVVRHWVVRPRREFWARFYPLTELE